MEFERHRRTAYVNLAIIAANIIGFLYLDNDATPYEPSIRTQ